MIKFKCSNNIHPVVVSMMETMSCPICEADVISDATAREYCAMCAMPIKDLLAMKKKNRKTYYDFCSKSCRDKYMEIQSTWCQYP